MNRTLTGTIALAVLIGLGACSEKQLVVDNPNSGDTKKVLATPSDAENLLGTYWTRWHNGVYGSTSSIEGMANMFSLQNYSSLANNCQNSHNPFSNAVNDNTPGNTCQGEQSRTYFIMGEVERVAANILTQMDAGLTFGSPAQDLRAKSFAEFLRGLSLGYMALTHDSGAVITTGMAGDDPGKMVGYRALHDSAMAAFQRAIDFATTTAIGSNGFPIPATWIPSPTTYTAAEFVKLIKSYRARIRAQVARDPAERAAADWTAIIADAQGGLTADQLISTTTTNGLSGSFAWRQQYLSFTTWHQMPGFIIGMADTSGRYDSWLAQPLGDRGAGNVGFFMVTPDKRFPQGANRTEQQADFALSSCNTAGSKCKRYFLNQANGGDTFSGLGFGWSNYVYVRYYTWNIAGDNGTARNGNTPDFLKAEVDLLQAEGQIRKGNFAAAATLINNTRVANGGLPAVTGAADGGLSGKCVPRVPTGPNGPTKCGDLMEAMKYEKRVETAFSNYATWYMDGRGWGDLPAGTPTFWAFPYQDMQARGYPLSAIYGAGSAPGMAPNSVSGKSTYGW